MALDGHPANLGPESAAWVSRVEAHIAALEAEVSRLASLVDTGAVAS